jgi:Spy/CpxP family protein refolding chaperone
LLVHPNPWEKIDKQGSFFTYNKRQEARSMKKAVIVLGIAVMVFLSFSYVYAQEAGVGPEPQAMPGPTHERHGKWLDLDPQQKAGLHELYRKFKKETAQLTGELVTQRLELRLLWSDPKADAKAILAQERRLQDLQNRMRDKVIEFRLETRKLLKPEQIERLGFRGGMGLGFGRGFHHRDMGSRERKIIDRSHEWDD